MIDALLIYPKLGSMDSMFIDLPLSIIYAASDSVKAGYNIKLSDLRTIDADWRLELNSLFKNKIMLAGVSVMTGKPLQYAKEISQYIRKISPETKIIWGGPHVTVVPDTINEPYIDFIIRGYGSKPLESLLRELKTHTGDFSQIPGISYKVDNKVVHNPKSKEHEIILHKDIPYALMDINSPKYKRTYNNQKMFPIFSSIGCPYKCTFCLHPTVYEELNNPKWKPIEVDEVVSHMEFIISRYQANHIVFIDDTSFPNIPRMKLLFEQILEKKINISLEFRGARINEIDRMTEDFLDLMVRAGTKMIMAGVESGSDRLLSRNNKNTTVEQILRVNKKLSRFPQIKVHYNFIYGMPGETYEDLLETKKVALQLIRDNPEAYIGCGSDWKPIPGTKMLEYAQKEYDYHVPGTLEEWIEIDSFDSVKKIVHPWYTKKMNNMIKLLQISSIVIDDKLIKVSDSNKSFLYKIFILCSIIYKPIALFRLKYNFTYFMIEYDIWRFIIKLLG